MKVFGIDIIKGSVRSKTIAPTYALVTADGGVITGEESVSLFRLQRLLFRHRPDILAVDSIQEIAPHTQDLYRFLEGLPPQTRLVSVTGGEKKTGLIQVAARFNITFNRLDPFAEAKAIALVASHETGVEVVAFEKETEIVVSRNRSPGKGGWSQNRYARKIHGNVLTYARDIGKELEDAGLNFWKKEFKAFGGVSRVVFHVREKRENIPVSTSRGGDVQVRIAGKRLERIQYRPLSGRPRYLIVGIDPGTTIGIAALDLNGELVTVHSSRQMTMSDTIELLYSLGKPIIIATDVSPMPFSVEKIRRAFQATPYVPRHDISVETKYDLAGQYRYSNDHERDALTAAIEAYRFWKHKFANVIKRVPSGVDLEEVRVGLIKGQSLEQILDLIRGPTRRQEEKRPDISIEAPDERVRVLDGLVKDLRGLVADLQRDLEQVKRENQRLIRQNQSLRSARSVEMKIEPEIAKRDLIIENLKHHLKTEEKSNKKLVRRLKRMKEADSGGPSPGLVAVKILPDLSRESVRMITERVGIRSGDILYIRSSGSWGKNIIHELAGIGLMVVVLGEKKGSQISPELRDISFEEELPIVSGADIPVQLRGELGYCNPDLIDDAISAWREEHSLFLRGKREEMFEGLFKEYQAERERQVKRRG
ncbi:MAG TPA: DUF460 domain-containing protein [Methanospirillum sp.]|nr:DUF460 domain-containing protein [Methanospirillum sp.]